ncbi:MAG: hypothetical protein FWH48_12300 [Oscillospiraceae bacterium]|nr:hypothetical protein [Oscillospiraceae bacterium]
MMVPKRTESELGRNRLYIIVSCTIFLFLFVWCPTSYILDQTGVFRTQDIKNYKDPEKFYESGPLSGFLNKIEEGKAGLENLYTNYLPMYGNIVTFLKTSDSDISFSFVSLLSKSAKKTAALPEGGDNVENAEIDEKVETIASIVDQLEFSTMMVQNDGLHKYYAIYPSDESLVPSFIDTILSFPEETLRKNMEEQIEHINRITKELTYTKADFYLYVGKRMQDAEYVTKIIPNEISTASYFGEFMDRIENAKGKGALNVDTLEKRMENVFRTDHHWSALGAYSGYVDIINMISKNSPEIGEPIPLLGLIAYPEVAMRGSAALISSFQRITETFSVMDIVLPEKDSRYKVTDNAQRYESGNFDHARFADHYALYYNRPGRYIYPKNNTGRRLLIIGDSYTWWSDWLIAANFDETYVYYPWDRKKLNLYDYIEENGITDVLMMLFSDRVIFNIYNDCPFENIITY